MTQQERSCGRGRSGGQGQGCRGNFGYQRNHQPKTPKKKLDSDEEVPMLTYGSSTNFATFREKLLIACIEKYGNLGKIIEDKKYWVPEKVDPNDFPNTGTAEEKEINRAKC